MLACDVGGVPPVGHARFDLRVRVRVSVRVSVSVRVRVRARARVRVRVGVGVRVSTSRGVDSAIGRARKQGLRCLCCSED